MTSDGASILFSVKLFPNLPAWAARRQAYVLPMFLIYFFFILNYFVRPVISTFTGPIFYQIVRVGRTMAVDERSEVSLSTP